MKNKALPLVLMHMKTTIRERANLSPFKIQFGRLPNTGMGPSGIPRILTGESEDEMLIYYANLSFDLQDTMTRLW